MTLSAGVPYIIKWDKAAGYDEADPATRDIKAPVFTGVTMESSSVAERTIEKADGNVKFIGYYDAFTINTSDNDDVIVDPKPDDGDGDGRSRIFGWGEDDE